MGKVSIIESGSDVIITLDGNTGDISVGGKGQNGNILIKDKLENVLAEIRAGQIIFFSPDGKQTASLLNTADFVIGGHGTGGDIHLVPPGASGVAVALEATISLDGDTGNIVLRSGGTPTIRLDGQKADLFLGGANQDGNVVLRAGGQDRIRLEGARGNVWLGGNGADGDVVLFASGGDNTTLGKATVHLNGGNGNLRLGGPGVDGNLALFRADVTEADSDNFDKATIHLNGNTGDIILSNADFAEDFDVANPSEIEPGALMVLDDEGRLRQSRDAYDRRVVGVVSGAGDCRPGIVMDRKPSPNPRATLAMVGKVYCRVDASHGAIGVGDLLTTSPTRGHAMRASDPQRAFGAVIGKALCPHAQGMGLVPILVALQ